MRTYVLSKGVILIPTLICYYGQGDVRSSASTVVSLLWSDSHTYVIFRNWEKWWGGEAASQRHRKRKKRGKWREERGIYFSLLETQYTVKIKQ